MKQFNRCKGISTPCFYKFQVPSKNCMFRLFCFNSGKFPLTFTFNSASFAISSRISHHVPIIFHQCSIIIHDSFRYIWNIFPHNFLNVHHSQMFHTFPSPPCTTLHSSARLRGRHVASPTGRRTRRRGADSAGARGLVSTIDGFWDWEVMSPLSSCFCWVYGFVYGCIHMYIYIWIYRDFSWLLDQ